MAHQLVSKAARAFPVLMESKPGSRSLFCRVSGPLRQRLRGETITGVHLSWKRSSKAFVPFATRFLLIAGIAAMAWLTAIVPVKAQDWTPREAELQDRIARLEAALQDLQSKVYSVETTGPDVPYEDRNYDDATVYPDSYASGEGGVNLAVRLDTIELEMQRLTGRLEQLAYRLDQQSRDLDALSQAVQLTAANSGGYNGSYTDDVDMNAPVTDVRTLDSGAYSGEGPLPDASTVNSDGANSDGTSSDMNVDTYARDPGGETGAPQDLTLPILPDDPGAAYSMAYQSLLDGRYSEAEAGFQAFLQKFPDDERAPDAQFRLGEIYLVTGAYGDAATAFIAHIQSWPQDIRAPESYLKLGTSFARAGKKKEACQVFGALKTKYPKASRSVLQRLSIERDRAGC
jgi:tol-pal system protein YbgF